jgi:flagellar hook-length control protein FliK
LRSQAEALTDTAMTMAGANPRFEAIIQRVERLQQLVENFEQHLSKLADQQGGSMSLELTPQALGRMTLNCDIKNGVMTLELVADNENARAVLANHAQAIRDLVQNSGYALAHLDVRARGEWSDQRPAPFRQAGENRRERKSGRERSTTNTPAVTGPNPSIGHPSHGVWLVA